MATKSATRQVVVANPAGLHARPSLAITSAVRRHQSKVQIHNGSQEVDAAEILQLLSLGAHAGTELVLTAQGPDADEVLDELVKLFNTQFGLHYD